MKYHLILWKHQFLCFHYWDYLTNFWRNNWCSIIDVVERLCLCRVIIHCAMQQISIYLSTLFRPFLSNEFLRKWVKHKTGQLFTFECRLLSNNALVSFAIKERFKSRFSGSGFYNMQKMSKGDYMEMDCTLCNAQLSTMHLNF